LHINNVSGGGLGPKQNLDKYAGPIWAVVPEKGAWQGRCRKAVKRKVQFSGKHFAPQARKVGSWVVGSLISGERQSVVYKLYPFQIEMRVKMQLTWSFWLSLGLGPWFWPCCYGHGGSTAVLWPFPSSSPLCSRSCFTVCAHI